MYKNEFQGGPHFEVFSAQGKDPVSHWKLTPASAIKKEFDRNVKSFVYVLDGSAFTTKMQLPKETKHALGLIQRFLIFQVFVPKGPDFSIDIGVQDMNHTKRRLFFSTAHKETQETPLHSKIPLGFVRKDMWINLCLDMAALVSEIWAGQTYRSIESICVSANCRLRRIFTMKAQPPDTSEDEEVFGIRGTNENVELDSIPKNCQLATDVQQETQVITVAKLRCFEGKKLDGGVPELDLNSSGGKKSSTQEQYHIAFGTKVSGKKTSRDGSATSRTSRGGSAGSKSRIDSGADGSHKSHRGDSGKRERGATGRERKNSDPGTKQDDPELTVDKESLRTSHTWTDGADGKEEIPFVRPHPPREPRELSAGGARRKPRVKSAGKERTPHKRTNSEGNSSHMERVQLQQPHVPKVVANDDEVAHIMLAMRESSRRDSGRGRSESESDPGSHDTSGVQDGDESISEVIQVLKRNSLPDGDSQPGEYEDSEEEEDSPDEDKIYTFSSPPKSAPRLNPKSKVQRNLSNSQKHKSRRRLSKSSDKLKKDRGAHPENDFVREGSSEEEESIQTRVRKKSPNPRKSPRSNDKRNGYTPHMYSSENVKPSGINAQNGLLSVPTPNTDNLVSPNTSQTRRSISRKSLREIPKDDVRLSQKDKPYNHMKYQMEDLTESFEQQMLMSLRRQTMEEGVPDSEDEKGQNKEQMDRLHYGNDSFSDESDDTMSTLKPQGAKTKHHNYQDEMKTSRLDQDFLTQSNPRDWGNGVFSPPIVLPSDIQKDQQKHKLSPSNFESSPKVNQQNHSPGTNQSDEEEELDLLYDPVLNCYFDPRTMKYYELT